MNKTIGQRIKERRKELKMSADDLAKKLSKDRSTIYRYEKGDIENLPIDLLQPIADALDMTPAALMGWDQEEIDAASMQIAEKNAYYDAHESVLQSFIEEISEMVFTPEDFQRMRKYAEMMQKADLRIISDYFYKVYQLQLTEEEIKDVYSYAQFIKSKRNT